MTDDDWAPLPADDLHRRPSDPQPSPRAAATAAAAAASTATVSPPRPPLTPDEEREAERALAALRAQLAHAEPATSFVAEITHRDQKAARKARACQLAELAATVAAVPAAAAPERTAAVAAPAAPAPRAAACVADDVDPREREPWFLELPAQERERLRAVWFAERHRHDDGWRARRRRLQRAFVYGGALFLVMGLLSALLLGGFQHVVPLALGGAIAALVAEACGGGRFVYAGCGGIAFAVVLGANVFLQPLCLVLILMASYGMGAIGMDGEMRRSGGFGDRDPVTAPPRAPRS
jgi:hypothetical protein